MFGGKLGITELLIIAGIALLFFGPSKLADLGKGLGEGLRGFKASLKDEPVEPTPPEAASTTDRGAA